MIYLFILVLQDPNLLTADNYNCVLNVCYINILLANVANNMLIENAKSIKQLLRNA